MRRFLGVPAIPLVAAAVLALGACGRPSPAPDQAGRTPPFRAVADVQLLMQAVIDPSADVVWDAVSTVITTAGIEERRPRSDEAWGRVRNSAVILAESGNLLMLEPRAYDRDSWMAMSRALVDISTEVLRLVEARDADGIFGIGGRLYDTCESCHRLYAYDDSPRRRK